MRTFWKKQASREVSTVDGTHCPLLSSVKAAHGTAPAHRSHAPGQTLNPAQMIAPLHQLEPEVTRGPLSPATTWERNRCLQVTGQEEVTAHTSPFGKY